MRGAFTGAVADRRGKFELAHGGTIFLDEIGDMSLKTQAKVLRVLQEQVMEPVGGSTRIKVDARVLAATNKDLPAEIRAGRFREDLYFRLNVVPIFVPPLRERPEDIPLLADHFMAMLAREYGRRPKTFDADAVAALQRYPWPGNVRELRNVVERLMIMVPGDRVSSRDLTFLDQGVVAAPQAAGVGARRRSRRCTMRATSSSASTSCARWRRSRATSRAPRRCSASSAATCTARCARFGIVPSRRGEDEETVVRRRCDIPTPALIVDVAALDRNIARMAAFFAAGACRLRPHFKAHKTPEIARRQLAAGSCVGITCATVSEAEVVAGSLRRCADRQRDRERRTSARARPRWRRRVASRSPSIPSAGLEALAPRRRARRRDDRRAG